MNGSIAANEALLAAVRELPRIGANVGVCAPYVYLPQAVQALDKSAVVVGAQDLSAHAASGAFTGEVSGAMLAEVGVRQVIVGHSERRQYHGETDEIVAAKALAALGAGLVPIVCVGETLVERDADQAFEVVNRQLGAVMAALGERINEVLVAYEPVWAIGTGRTASPEQAQEVHASIRAKLGSAGAVVPVLYGGSVKASNASSIFAMSDVDGGLIGGASLVAGDFAAIVAAL